MKLRHSLSDESARASCVLGSWTTLPGAIPRSHIIQVFKDKSRRVRKKQRIAEPEDDDIVMVD